MKQEVNELIPGYVRLTNEKYFTAVYKLLLLLYCPKYVWLYIIIHLGLSCVYSSALSLSNNPIARLPHSISFFLTLSLTLSNEELCNINVDKVQEVCSWTFIYNTFVDICLLYLWK